VPTINEIVRGVTYGARDAASSIPKLIAGILRLNLIAVFLIYSGALTLEFWPHSWGSALIALSALLFFILALVIFIKGWKKNWKDENLPETDLGSMWTWAAPAAIVVLGTALIGLWGYQFSSWLLRETSKRLVNWITPL
jgi:hypothetical protein